MLTVTFGVSCAPYLAIRTLHQLAQDEKLEHPAAANCLVNDFYVDDALTGSDTIEDLNLLKTDLINLLKKGGFHLRKFSSNHESILHDIPPVDRSQEMSLNLDGKTTIKALGIHWEPTSDTSVGLVQLS